MANNHSKLKQRNPPTTTQTKSTLEAKPTGPKDSAVAGKPSMFTNAQNFHISGGSFNIVNTITGDAPSLDVLHQRVAPNAILNAGGRADEVRCHPGTREEVIGRIEKWGDAEDDQTPPIFWLSGPAGAGKSAIMQTIAERCEERGVPHANFFFFRADTSRSNASPLIATLLHQIILLYPSLRDPVARLLSTNPLIFDSTLEDQLAQLIVTPLHSVQQSSSAHRPLLLLIDGLDECDSQAKRSQQQILRVFDKVLVQKPQACPFRLLVASRDESQIQAAFNGLSSPCLRLYLDDQYSPENDIRVFVKAQFEQVRKTHPLVYMLPDTWPLAEDINYIVEKSSGQFIYAATVMRYILESSAIPKVSLERVKGAARLATKSPLSNLDAIYTYILTQVYDQEVVKDILHAQVLVERFSSHEERLYGRAPRAPRVFTNHLRNILEFYNPRYTKEIIVSCLADLTPIARYIHGREELLFYHASFSDYLLQKSRSTDYFVDVTSFNYKFLSMFWEHTDYGTSDPVWERFGVNGILELHKLPPCLLGALVSSHCRGWDYCIDRPMLLRKIHDLCTTDDDIGNFRHILRLASRVQGISEDIKNIPFGDRYFQMARADDLIAPDNEMLAAICPSTDFDRQESAEWIDKLSCRIRSRMRLNTANMEPLLRAWISWATQNNIPCSSLDNLLNEYRTKNWFANALKFIICSTK